MKNYITLYVLLLLLCSCVSNQGQQTSPLAVRFQWTPQESGTQASLRGLSVVDSLVVWASGSEGTVLRTTDGGNHWQRLALPDTDTTDFRDIAAFDATTAYLLSAGAPGLVYKTEDGGATWQLQYKNTSLGIFFDAFAFWDADRGIAMSDPVEGHFVLIRTENGGSLWEEVPADNIPSPVEGEAGFAASGTGLVVQGERHVWFATGGQQARVFRSADRGLHWAVAETPMLQGQASSGIFSIAFIDTLQGAAVGGNYQEPDANTQNACFTTDGGLSWQLAITPPRGYRSGVAYNTGRKLLMAVGTSGSDYSTDGGKNWLSADTTGYHSIQFVKDGQVGWATGAEGRIAKISLENEGEIN